MSTIDSSTVMKAKSEYLELAERYLKENGWENHFPSLWLDISGDYYRIDEAVLLQIAKDQLEIAKKRCYTFIIEGEDDGN